MHDQYPSTVAPILLHERFIESSPEISANLARISAWLEGQKLFNTEIVGAALFGSTLKGNANAESDFDMNIFLDEEVLHRAGIATGSDGLEGDIVISNRRLRADYTRYISGHLAQLVGKPVEKIEEGIILTPISERLIDEKLDAYKQQSIARQRAYDQYWLASSRWFRSGRSGPSPQTPDILPYMPRNICALFRAELTSGLGPYRTRVLGRLKDMGQVGEKAWEEIMSDVKFFEGHLDDSRYPRTVDEAVDKFQAVIEG